MTTSTDHSVKVLNGLIQTTVDSAKGYRDAAQHADNPEFKSLFERRASEREQAASELQGEVRSFGGKPETDSGLLGTAHRTFLNLKDTFSRGDKAVIDEVERGEDYIKGKFEAAMRDDELAPSARERIARVFTTVKSGHDEVSALKHRLN